MALNIQTTKEIKEINLTTYENAINQESPLNDKSFLLVTSAVEAGNFTTIYKYAAERARQCLALTATGDDLDLIGGSYGVPRKAAEAWRGTIEAVAVDDTEIPATVNYVSDSNGGLYPPDADVIATGGLATSNIQSEELGGDFNLSITDTLTIDTNIPGLDPIATVTAILNTGADEETDDDYRQRILDKIRAVGGGGNAADYREWAQEPAGVKRAYPYSGEILDIPNSAPPDRTVFIEATTDIDPDGIAPQSLLDEARESITTDPETGIARQPLGLTDDTLFVESITRIAFYVEVRGLTVDPAIESQVKDDINAAFTTFFSSITMFVDGLDFVGDRNDTVTDPVVSAVVQDVLMARALPVLLLVLLRPLFCRLISYSRAN
jgi:hypothetical protein